MWLQLTPNTDYNREDILDSKTKTKKAWEYNIRKQGDICLGQNSKYHKE